MNSRWSSELWLSHMCIPKTWAAQVVRCHVCLCLLLSLCKVWLGHWECREHRASYVASDEILIDSWEDGSVVKNTDCRSRRLSLISRIQLQGIQCLLTSTGTRNASHTQTDMHAGKTPILSKIVLEKILMDGCKNWCVLINLCLYYYCTEFRKSRKAPINLS